MPRHEVGNSAVNHRNLSHKKYGSKIEITRQILSVVNDNANNGHYHVNKRKIMYKAMLSWLQLKEYLSVLVESGLLEYHDYIMEDNDPTDDGTYTITEKGRNLLSAYNEID